MAIRAVQITRLELIASRKELLPPELRSLELPLVFELLFDAVEQAGEHGSSGGSWGRFYTYRDKREANVVLTMHGYLATDSLPYATGSGALRTRSVYVITEKGKQLLDLLKGAAGIF